MTTTPIEAQLASAGLRLFEADIAKLQTMVADIEAAAAAIRKDRSYLEEPVHTLNLAAR